MGSPASRLSLTISSVMGETKLVEDWFLCSSLRGKESFSMEFLLLTGDLDLRGIDMIFENEERRIFGRNMSTGDSCSGSERQLID